MPERLSVARFDELYATFSHSVFRWETQPAYHEPEEAEPLRRWLAGEQLDHVFLADWLATIRAATNAGKRFERVRVFQEPPTDYQRWATEITPANIAAGEAIRIMGDGVARELELPAYDFCIFDDHLVARMEFGRAGFTGAGLSDDTDEVARHRSWRDAAWQHAVPFHDYRVGQPAERST